MVSNCPVDRIVRSAADLLQLPQGNAAAVMEQVIVNYLVTRNRLSADVALRTFGPELEDLATVLTHAIDHTLELVEDQLMSTMADVLGARGMTKDQLTALMGAHALEAHLTGVLGRGVSVHAVPMGGLADLLVDMLGPEGADMAAEVVAASKTKEVLH